MKTPEWCEMKRSRRQTWHVRSDSLRKIAEELEELRGNGGDWVGRGASVLQELAAAEHDWWLGGKLPAIRALVGEMSRSDRIEGNEAMLLSAVAAVDHILSTYHSDVMYETHDSLEGRVRTTLVACHMNLDVPLALGLANEMSRLLMTDERFAAEWAYVAGLVGREPHDLLSMAPWDMKSVLVLAHAALSGWDVGRDIGESGFVYDERLDGARAAWAAGRYDYDLRGIGVDWHPSWEGGVEDDVSFARGALICLGLQSWDDPSLNLAAAASRHAMAGYGAGGVLLPVVGVMVDYRMTSYGYSLFHTIFDGGPVDIPHWLRTPAA